MSKLQHDINDDEIRVISRGGAPARPLRRKFPACRIAWAAAAVLGITALTVWALWLRPSDDARLADRSLMITAFQTPADCGAATISRGYVSVSDTVVNGVSLTLLTPVNASPRLAVGAEALNGQAVMAVWAADLRADNGQIVGTFVADGDLVGKGESKAGFCAIIDGTTTIGAADATPMLERALEVGGCFFRQYPLVVGNQVVENRPRGKALRKALAQLDDRLLVAMSRTRLSYSDFSRALADLGVSNAISLVGGDSYGFAIDDSGQRLEFGRRWSESPPCINYIVWQ